MIDEDMRICAESALPAAPVGINCRPAKGCDHEIPSRLTANSGQITGTVGSSAVTAALKIHGVPMYMPWYGVTPML